MIAWAKHELGRSQIGYSSIGKEAVAARPRAERDEAEIPAVTCTRPGFSPLFEYEDAVGESGEGVAVDEAALGAPSRAGRAVSSTERDVAIRGKKPPQLLHQPPILTSIIAEVVEFRWGAFTLVVGARRITVIPAI
ncbi:MAG: hypothetical protein JXR94_13115 [Candidatus Hydrogenedentes bacterium]|nr:hypothetical protein [Candidatus Hydrogenedentota bacterium]